MEYLPLILFLVFVITFLWYDQAKQEYEDKHGPGISDDDDLDLV